MPLDDIYRADFNFEGPTSVGQFSVHYLEDASSLVDTVSCRVLAVALQAHLNVEILAVISARWRFVSVDVNKMFDDPEPRFRADSAASLGTRSVDSLPANNAMLMSLQAAGPSPRSNGRIFIPGIGETDTSVGVLTAAFLTGFADPLAAKLALTVPEDSGGAGRWDPIVISRIILDAAPPAKNWAGAALSVSSVTAQPIIATQRRRTTAVHGTR